MSSKVMILMGSDSDWPVMKKAVDVFKEFSVPFEVHISSAHRTPERTTSLVSSFSGDCFLVGAGFAAHLAGVVAAHTTKPVIAVPINSSSLLGLDSLFSTVQMPSGIPVATMAIDGAKNAALFICQILSLSDKDLANRLIVFRKNLSDEVLAKDTKIKNSL